MRCSNIVKLPGILCNEKLLYPAKAAGHKKIPELQVCIAEVLYDAEAVLRLARWWWRDNSVKRMNATPG